MCTEFSLFPFPRTKHCGVEGAEKALSYTYVHKITNVSVLYIEYTLNDFDVDQSFPCFYFLHLHPYSYNKTPLPIQQNTVRMWGMGEKNLFSSYT
jgi:hypothetical protein